LFWQCRQLLSHIKSARKSIDVAVYCISFFEIADVVLLRHKVGVKVRVITDKSMEIAYGSQNHRFMKEGAHINSNISQQVYLTFL
jgi:cardiolipin hydrolase